eukprot:489850_1
MRATEDDIKTKNYNKVTEVSDKAREQSMNQIAISDNNREEFRQKAEHLQNQINESKSQKVILSDDMAIKKVLDMFAAERIEIHQRMAQQVNKKDLPLHRFNIMDVCNKIKQWVYDDINYKQYLIRTMRIFSDKGLSGSLMNSLTNKTAKDIVQNELSAFMTHHTLQIMFDCFYKHKTILYIANKHAAEVGYIIYQYPLNNLLTEIKNEKIDGNAFVHHLGKTEKIMKEATGWPRDEVEQLITLFFRHKAFKKDEFIDNMKNIIAETNDHQSMLPNTVRFAIENTIKRFDVEKLVVKIKNDKHVREFSHIIINMVETLVENNEEHKINNNNVAYLEDDFVKRIYELIGDCFVFNDTLNQRANDWRCSNCTNYNFYKLIGKKVSGDLSICCLCGIQQTDSVILKVKGCDTFQMVNKIIETHRVNEEKKDNVDKLIETAIQKNSFNLSCPNQNHNKQCVSLLRLAKQLIIYKRWLYTVYEKTNGQDDINKTIKFDIAKCIDDEEYKAIVIKSAKETKKIEQQ